MDPAAWVATPDLTGEHVALTALRPEHAEGILAAADADEVFAHISSERPRDLAAARDLVSSYLALEGVHPWAQLDARTHEVLGVTTYYDVDPSLRTLAIGYTWLAQRAWRTPVNTEAKLLLLRRAFEDLGCVRVAWHTDVRNERSQAAIARLGVTREGVLRKHKRRRDGSWRDTVLYAMTDDDWPAARARLAERLTR